MGVAGGLAFQEEKREIKLSEPFEKRSPVLASGEIENGFTAVKDQSPSLLSSFAQVRLLYKDLINLGHHISKLPAGCPLATLPVRILGLGFKALIKDRQFRCQMREDFSPEIYP